MLDHRAVYLMHMFIVAPLFVYLWYVNNILNKKIGESISVLLLIFGVVIFFYHGYKLYKYQKIMSN